MFVGSREKGKLISLVPNLKVPSSSGQNIIKLRMRESADGLFFGDEVIVIIKVPEGAAGPNPVPEVG
jgi:hypothetical protein